MNYSYVTLLTSDTYIDGVLLLKESLRMVNSKYPLLCITTDNLSKETFEILNKANISYKTVKPIPVTEAIYKNNYDISPTHAEVWKYTFTKFYIWTLTDFDKLIFLDADLLIYKNLDHCFEYDELTAAVDGEYFNLWPNDLHFNSGFMVIKPSAKTFEKLLAFAENIVPEKTFNYLGERMIIADQDILNMYFKKWKTDTSKHLDKYYNMFAPYILKDQEADLIHNCQFIHFVGFKPWKVNEFYKLANTKKLVSSYFFCLAAAIILCVKDNNYKDLDWNSDTVIRKAAYIAMNLINDLDTVNLFVDGEAYKEAVELKEPLTKIMKHILEKNLVSGVYTHDLLVGIEIGNVNIITDIYKLIENTIVEKYKKY